MRRAFKMTCWHGACKFPGCVSALLLTISHIYIYIIYTPINPCQWS